MDGGRLLGAAEAEAKQDAWRAASVEENGGGELLVSNEGEAVGGEITVVDCERG